MLERRDDLSPTIRLVFRYGHEHRPAVKLNRINLIAVRRDELPRHMRHIVGIGIEGFADDVQQAARGDMFSAIHLVARTVIEPGQGREF